MCLFMKDERASEEFTSLPALAIVMIGFTLFFMIVVGVYNSYKESVESIEYYSDANYLLEKLTSADSPIVKNGCIDFQKLDHAYEEIVEKYRFRNEFMLKISTFDGKNLTIGKNGKEGVSASKIMPAIINDVEAIPIRITVILWI